MRTTARFPLRALALILLGLACTFTVSAAQLPPCDTPFHVPYSMHLRPLKPCGGDSVTLVFGACRPCVDLVGYQQDPGGPIEIDVRLQQYCPTNVCLPDTIEVPIGRLAAGNYAMLVMLNTTVVNGDSAVCHTMQLDSLTFAVGCPVPPPPPPPPSNTLPYVYRIDIGTPVICPAMAPEDSCPRRICPNLPIRFAIAGAFPDGCFRFEKLELLPSMIVGPRIEPPIVRVTAVVQARMACPAVLEPWHADTLLPALPPGTYELPLELRLVTIVSGNDPATSTDTTFRAHRTFIVPDSCDLSKELPCVWANWVHAGGFCDAFFDGDAKAVLTVMSGVALAGLQGELSLSPPGLLISSLTPVGRAEGMHIAWQRTATGAKFLMFAERGAPIGQRLCVEAPLCPEPVLAVGMVKDTDAVLSPVTYLRAETLLGADSLGREVPECAIETFVPNQARICAGPSCDFNHDGRRDVRDLVTMVHCILQSGPCPDTSRTGLDCNADGHLDIDDVMCCARTILIGGERDTTGGRAEPGVALRLDAPAWSADGLDLPLALEHADLVGAARVVLNFPADRYDVAGVDLAPSAPGWLVLHEVVDGKLVIGAIGLGLDKSAAAFVGTLGMKLRLVPRAGAGGGGEVSIAEAQFSGPDGVTLKVPANLMPAPLPDRGALALSAARPNPFGGETRLSLNLDRGADVDVAVYDLSGRRVATLHRGPLAAGPHELAWRGTQDSGARAHAGVYFVQARVGDRKLARKVVFLRGD